MEDEVLSLNDSTSYVLSKSLNKTKKQETLSSISLDVRFLIYVYINTKVKVLGIK